MAAEASNSGWVKCTDSIWRRPSDYADQVLPVPALAVQPPRPCLPNVIPAEDLIVTCDRQFGTGLDTWEF